MTKIMNNEHILAHLMGHSLGVLDPFDATNGNVSAIVGSELKILEESTKNDKAFKVLCQKTLKCINIDVCSAFLLFWMTAMSLESAFPHQPSGVI